MAYAGFMRYNGVYADPLCGKPHKGPYAEPYAGLVYAFLRKEFLIFDHLLNKKAVYPLSR